MVDRGVIRFALLGRSDSGLDKAERSRKRTDLPKGEVGVARIIRNWDYFTPALYSSKAVLNSALASSGTPGPISSMSLRAFS